MKIAIGRLTSVPWMRHFQRSLHCLLLTFVFTSLILSLSTILMQSRKLNRNRYPYFLRYISIQHVVFALVSSLSIRQVPYDHRVFLTMPFPYALGCSPHDSAQLDSHEGSGKCVHHYALCGLKYAATSMAIPTTAYITDLQARLAVLHDDYQELKKENDQKRAIIDHLLTPKTTEPKVATSNAITNTSQPTVTSNNEDSATAEK